MTDEALFRYVVAVDGAEHHVFLVRDESPEWWRLVATFRDAERAQCYAEVEQGMADDTALGEATGELTTGHRDDEAPPPAGLRAPPPSSLGALVRRSTIVEHTRLERHETQAPPEVTEENASAGVCVVTMKPDLVEAMVKAVELPPSDMEAREKYAARLMNEAFGAPQEPRPDPIAEAVEEEAVVVPPPPAQAVEPRTLNLKLVDAATLSPLSERQIAAFNALWKLYDENPLSCTVKAIGLEAKLTSVAHALSGLRSKKYIIRDTNVYPIIFRPIATGIPQLYVHQTKQKPVVAAKPNGNDTHTHTEVIGDPAVGRSAFDKKRLLDELDPVGYLSGKGHTVKRFTSDLYQFDGATVNLRRILEQVNIYRTRAKIPAVNLKLYI